jgi:large subunit ribosomal protein L3
MGMLGKKLGMTQVFSESGERRAVTAIATGPCVVIAHRTPDRDGYAAVQVGFGEQPERLVRRPERGAFKKAGVTARRMVREFRLPDGAGLTGWDVGREVRVADLFKPGDRVDVTGVSKGKGYQGVIKRYHFKGSVEAHGSHEFFRHGGSIGCRLTPGRVHKGKRMTGHLGAVRRTVQSLRVVDVIAEQNVLLVEGAVPGARNGFLTIRPAVKRKATPPA